jgi:hypothetical protein
VPKINSITENQQHCGKSTASQKTNSIAENQQPHRKPTALLKTNGIAEKSNQRQQRSSDGQVHPTARSLVSRHPPVHTPRPSSHAESYFPVPFWVQLQRFGKNSTAPNGHGPHPRCKSQHKESTLSH